MRILLFEDATVARLAPVTLGRPAYAIGCAGTRLLTMVRELGEVHCLVRPHLKAIEAANPAVRVVESIDDDEPWLIINARLAPLHATFERLEQLAHKRAPALLVQGEQVVAALVSGARPALSARPDAAALTAWLRQMSLPTESADLPLFEYPHDILRHHAAGFNANLERWLAQAAADGKPYREIADGVFVAADVTLGEHLVTDSRRGPIVIDDEAELGPFCYLRGPVYIGPAARLNEHSALKDGVMLGERTKVGGEVESSIVEAFSNKQHHGFLGHSYIGSWVNLGAGTSNSDLKNTYGEVNMEYAGRKTPTGLQFVGCFVGEYTKMAVNSSIFTGKTIGVCSMVYGFVTTNVPSFINYARSFGQVSESPVEVAVSAQSRMFSRRGIPQRPCDVQLLRDMYELTRAERANYGEPLSPEPLSL